ncbi:MAG: thiolase family protein [Thermoleophilia bacterium]|nr:thiolase family protein [Thermoleophilia bacterium]
MTGAFICEAVRSPIGKRKGALSATRADDLLGDVLKGLVARAEIEPSVVEDVITGCVTQIGEQGWNIGRMGVLAAGFPVEVCGTTVNRQCGSSLQTTNFGAQAIIAGQADVVISAGVESMTRTLMGTDGGDVSPRIMEKYSIIPQGYSAEMIAAQWKITREQLDEYSWNSHQRALHAQREGWFDNEILPLSITTHEGENITFSVDQTPRDSPLEKVASLPPAFNPEGVITAGNASQICDGSAALLLASEAGITANNLTPRARIVATGLAGVDPTIMLTGNPAAMQKALKRAGLTLDDMGVIEVNEAFAVVALQTMHDLKLTERYADFNPVGGGISLGHPLGATGCRILATMLNEMERRDVRYGIASACIGFGMAIATIIERV